MIADQMIFSENPSFCGRYRRYEIISYLVYRLQKQRNQRSVLAARNINSNPRDVRKLAKKGNMEKWKITLLRKKHGREEQTLVTASTREEAERMGRNQGKVLRVEKWAPPQSVLDAQKSWEEQKEKQRGREDFHRYGDWM